MNTPLKLAVVGHTNTGKTSLMRTLLRDSQFGEVKNAASTTRHVEEARIGEFVYLYDTPGLEDAGGILDWLETETPSKLDGIERLNLFLNSTVASHEFSQEAKVLRQLLQSDCALYVIDAREPVLPKYKDELTVLSWCAKPIMPVFNFTAGRDLGEWQTMLARRSLHVSSSFDTVAFDFDGEIRLWDNLATMLSTRQILDDLIAHRRQEWQRLDREARTHIAHFLLDVAAYRQSFENAEQIPELQHAMQSAVRQLERNVQQQLFQLYRFYHQELTGSDWVLNAFRQDPFDADLLKTYGIRTTKGAATGALIGLGLDVMTLGLSLGTGTAIGGVIGGLLPNWKTLADKFSGVEHLLIDAPTLTVLAARECEVLATLQSRGHAAQQALALHNPHAPWSPDRLPEELNKARQHPQWSVLNGISAETATQSREPMAERLAERLKNN